MLAPFLFGGTSTSLDAVLDDPKLGGAIKSAHVQTLDGKVLYERNSSLHMVPASNQKLLSASYALHVLGPEYRPVTRIWKQGKVVTVDSQGDPLLSVEQLIALRDRLRINPQSIVRVRQAYAPGIPPTWEHDDLPNKYAAPISSFSLNRASFELWVRKGKVVAEPSSFGARIIVQPSARPLEVLYDPFEKAIQVRGSLPPEDKRIETLSVLDPAQQAAFLLGERFVPVSMVPTIGPDATLTGKSIADLIAATLPPSDNNIAEHLMLLAASRHERLGEDAYAVATARMKSFLTGVVGIEPLDVKPYDGSGLSRHNYITTRALSKLLLWADRQPTAALWRSSLASSSKGTLANRLSDVKFFGKTGTLDMVVALSGYVQHESGKTLIASVILNQYGCSATEARKTVDEFITSVGNMDLSGEADGTH